MKHLQAAATAALVAAVIAGGVLAGQPAQEQGPVERAAERLEEAGKSVKRGLKDASDRIRGQFASARDSIHSMGIEARVYGRLHWDKLLTNSVLEVEINNGVATLRGSVASAKAKARAVELAKETVGITEVVDQLAVQPPPKTAPATISDPTTKS
ncbi:MAG: BON domain-containing protein [Isosphaeraceae bacterium]